MSWAVFARRFLTTWRVILLDCLLAVLLAVASADGLAELGTATAGWWLLCAFPVVALLLRHRWPLPALGLAGAGAVIHWWAFRGTGTFPQPIDLAGLIVLFSVASFARSRRLSIALCVVVMAAVYGAAILNGSAAGGTGFWTPIWPSNTVIVAQLAIALAFILGDGVRSRRTHLRALGQRAADLEREQQQRAQLSAAAERARIARDLHDIVAHRVTAMLIQAGAAKAILAGRPKPAIDALEAVEAGGRAAMVELRSLLGMLVTPGPDAPHTPAPGIAVLPALTEGAGLPVRLTVTGDPARLPRGIDLAAYRIVQEALTNALRHSSRTGTCVDVRVGEQTVEIDVLDDAPPPSAATATSGRGLVGIRERVATYAGTFGAGPQPDGRWRVRATLPIPQTTEMLEPS